MDNSTYEVWCYNRSKKNDKYVEKNWYIFNFHGKGAKKRAELYKDKLNKEQGFGLENPNSIGRKYYIINTND